MNEDRPTATLDRRDDTEDLATLVTQIAIPVARTEQRADDDEREQEQRRAHGRRRWNDPDEKLMLWGALGFFFLGLYAAIFVAFGMWLTP